MKKFVNGRRITTHSYRESEAHDEVRKKINKHKRKKELMGKSFSRDKAIVVNCSKWKNNNI